MRGLLLRIFAGAVFCLVLSGAASAQTPSIPRRILQPVDESRRATLAGNKYPLARTEFDQGAAPPDLPMERMLLVLKRSPDQESALQRLLDSQQDKSSPNYHHWLTPEQFGQQFGPADQDIQTITSWLTAHGFQISRVAKSGMVIEFSGTASQVRDAFSTDIHRYIVNGESHWANAAEPQIPSALLPVVAGVNSLHNFRKSPMHKVGGVFSRSKATGQIQTITSNFTFPNPSDCGTACYFVGPYDFATIYNVLPLWNGSPAIDGTGESIAIVGESNINLQDIRNFRALFSLPPNDPQVILDGPDPGLVNSIVSFSASSCTISPTGSLSTCSFSPATVTGTGTAQVTIQTTAPQSAFVSQRRSSRGSNLVDTSVGYIVFLFALAFAPAPFLRRRSRLAIAVSLILVGVLVFQGCGGGPSSNTNGSGSTANSGTPTGVTYAVTVTAVGGAITHSATFNFVVK